MEATTQRPLVEADADLEVGSNFLFGAPGTPINLRCGRAAEIAPKETMGKCGERHQRSAMLVKVGTPMQLAILWLPKLLGPLLETDEGVDTGSFLSPDHG